MREFPRIGTVAAGRDSQNVLQRVMVTELPSATLPRPMSRRRLRLAAAGFLVLAAAIAYGVRAYTLDYLARDAASRGIATLNFHAEAFEGALDKYRILPAMLARRVDLRAMIRGAALFERAESGSADMRQASRDLLGEHAALTGALAIMVSTSDGRVFASSLDDRPELAVGARLAGQAHFVTALDGRLGRQIIVLPDGRRLYLFSTQVRADELVGVVTVAVDMERLERPWALTRDTILAYEPDGLIVLSNREELRLRSLAASVPPTGSEAGPLVIEGGGQGRVVRIDDPALTGRYVMSLRAVPVLEWTMMALGDAAPVARRATLASALAASASLLVSGIVLSVLQRRRNLAQKLRDDRAVSLRLERLVRDRTRDLRQARNELIQATKLAALGQMSAAIAHEFNQPLAAIVSNADNAQTLIARGDDASAIENITRIRKLVDRLGSISRALKTFARKPRSHLQPVSLKAVCEAAMAVLQPKRRESGVDVTLSDDGGDVMVMAGAVRMEQVIVNLVANAIDAARARHRDGGGRVDIRLWREDGAGVVSVRDNGGGIAVSPKDAVFDPFVTTKEGGEGLGLGLSITYNIVKDFSGTIVADSALGEGAVFTVRLPMAGDGGDTPAGGD